MSPAKRGATIQRGAIHAAIALGLLWALAGCASEPEVHSGAFSSLEAAAADAPQAEAQALAIATARCAGAPPAYQWQPAQPRQLLPPAALARGRLASADIEGDLGLGTLVYRCS